MKWKICKIPPLWKGWHSNIGGSAKETVNKKNWVAKPEMELSLPALWQRQCEVFESDIQPIFKGPLLYRGIIVLNLIPGRIISGLVNSLTFRFLFVIPYSSFLIPQFQQLVENTRAENLVIWGATAGNYRNVTPLLFPRPEAEGTSFFFVSLASSPREARMWLTFL